MKIYSNLQPQEYRRILSCCSGKKIALDTETTGLLWYKHNLITIGFFCPEAELGGTIDIGDNWSIELQQQIRQYTREALQSGTAVIMHNAKFDLHFLDANPNETGWLLLDTAVMVHLNDSRARKSLEVAEAKLLGTASKREHVDAVPKGARGKSLKIWEWPPELRQAYCLNDCRVTYQLAEALHPHLKTLGLAKLFAKDMKYIKTIFQVEQDGTLIDPVRVKEGYDALTADIRELENELYEITGLKFNWRSAKQLSAILYEGMGHPRPKNPFADADGVDRSRFAVRGQYNKTLTSSFILNEKAKHPLGSLISSLRETWNLRNVLKNWLNLHDEHNFVHTNFNLTGTRTGRLSSSKPNIQNIANKYRNVFTGDEREREEEYNLRDCFIALEGHEILAIDYKQMEIFYFGIVSQEPAMLEFIKSGQDIHSQIAMRVWGSADSKHRKWSKQISLGLLYGMTTGSLVFKLDMSKAEVNKVVSDYWNQFPRIRPWLFEVIDTCKQQGYVRYWSNRIWREDQEDKMYRGANAIIQGGMADMLSIAVMRTAEWLEKNPVGKICNIVHDEIIFYIKEGYLEFAAAEISKIMQVPDLFGIPFRVDIKAGTTYGNTIPLKEYLNAAGNKSEKSIN